jgi:ubiquinone/menaquinone biosynthesis C-methylase UbiE
MTQEDQYFLGYSPSEQDRLRWQAQQLAHEASWLLDRIGLAPEACVVEIGCGPQGCLDLLAERVGPQGSVVGVERGEDAVGLARRFAQDRGLANVEVLHADARTSGLSRGSFDLATARLVLVNVPNPEEIVAEMIALVRPGGVVALHEADWVAHACDPPHPAWDRLKEALVAYSRSHRVDLFVGRRVARMLHAAGLVEVQVNPLVHVYPPGHGRRLILLQFVENLRTRLLAEGFLDEAELEELTGALWLHLEDPGTLVVSHLFFQVWGRKPAPERIPT